MAKKVLPTNFMDDILNESMNGKRRWTITQNDDGTYTLEDATTYDQLGNTFGQAQVNEMNKAINESVDQARVIDDYKTLAAVNQEGFVPGAKPVAQLISDLKVVKEHSVWEQIGTLSGTAQKIFDFSQCEEICLVTTCAGNAKLVYTVKIPVVVLSEDKIHVCNGGYTAGTGAQCEWEISKTSCRLLACYVGGTNYTGSATTIYAR
jgi:hypothetical protein